MPHTAQNPDPRLNPDSRPLSPDPSRPGRPRFLDDTKRAQLIAIVANGCGVTAAARYLGCHPRTIRRECSSDPSFRQELKRAEFEGQLEPIQNLRKAGKTHWRANAWLLERSRPYAFTPTKADLFNNDDVNDLIDGINGAIIKAIPDRQLADQVIENIENYVAKKSDDLLHEDPKEKRRRSAARQAKEAIARRRANPEPVPEILDGFPFDDEDQDTSQYTSEEEFATDAHELESSPADVVAPAVVRGSPDLAHAPTEGLPAADPAPADHPDVPPASPPHPLTPSPAHPFMPFDLPPSGSTVTVHPLYPTPAAPSSPPAGSSLPTADCLPPTASHSAFCTQHFVISSLPTAPCSPPTRQVTQLTKPQQFCHTQPSQPCTFSRAIAHQARTIFTNFASPCGTPATSDKTDQTKNRSSLLAASPASHSESPLLTTDHGTPTTASHTHHSNQPYSPISTPHSPAQSPSQIQIVPPRPKVRRFTKRRLCRRLNELEMHVHQLNLAVAQVAAMLEQLAAPDQPSRPIGFCPPGPTQTPPQ